MVVCGCVFQLNRICPHVLWSQQKSSLLLAIQLRECSYDDIDVKFEERSVSFRYIDRLLQTILTLYVSKVYMHGTNLLLKGSLETAVVWI